MNNNQANSSNMQKEVVNSPRISPKISKTKYNSYEELRRWISPSEYVIYPL